MDISDKIAVLANEFAAGTKFLTAIGDETRQHLILEMMKMEKCSGVRVGEITQKTNLSRSAVSHHLQILKNAGIVQVRKEGTKNYYYFDLEMKAFKQIIYALQLALELSEAMKNEATKNNVLKNANESNNRNANM